MQEVSDFGTKLYSESIKNGIIIYNKGITPLAKQNITELSDVLKIEFFDESELVINITKHELVPKHLLITLEEKKNLLKR